MIVVRTLAELDAACDGLRARYGKLALVPTMGALHAGHRALVDAAVTSGAATATSIFVNPLQFAANEDLANYPRDEAGDLASLRAAGNHLVWIPDVATMYPSDNVTLVDVSGPPAERWEAEHRPGHFRGMATVVTKLFGQVRPDAAYFGEKDWQQLQVVRRFVADLHLRLEIVGIATVREADGLALSSRNRFLTPQDRPTAAQLNRTIRAAAAAPDVPLALAWARQQLTAARFNVDYLALVDGPTLAPLDRIVSGARIIAAAQLGRVRLIDNIAA
ncbi:MAG: pantoate--beta-alanine ligase [Acetobacteraceae bacterium]|nr:pantoate--beta-alanine ligase [Acetobacteraceae bacterium]